MTLSFEIDGGKTKYFISVLKNVFCVVGCIRMCSYETAIL